MELQELHSYICRQKKPSLNGARIEQCQKWCNNNGIQ